MPYGVAFGVFVRGFGVVDITNISLRCDGRIAAEIRTDSAFTTSGLRAIFMPYPECMIVILEKCLRVERQPETTLQSADIVDVNIGNGLKL